MPSSVGVGCRRARHRKQRASSYAYSPSDENDAMLRPKKEQRTQDNVYSLNVLNSQVSVVEPLAAEPCVYAAN